MQGGQRVQEENCMSAVALTPLPTASGVDRKHSVGTPATVWVHSPPFTQSWAIILWNFSGGVKPPPRIWITHHAPSLVTGDALGSGGSLGAQWAAGFSSTWILRPVPACPHAACLFSPTHKKKTWKWKVYAACHALPAGPRTLRPDS